MKKHTQFFCSGSSAKITGTLTTGPAVKKHISSEMARELIAVYPTMYHLWFLVYQRVLPQLHFHLLLPCLMSTDRPKIQYKKEVEVRVKSFGETRCMNPQKPKTKIEMENQREVFFGQQVKVTRSVSKVNSGQRVHVRDAEGVCRTSPHPQHPAVPKQNKEKTSIKVSTIAPGQNTLHVGAAVSYCVIRFIGRPDKPRFNALSSNAVNIES